MLCCCCVDRYVFSMRVHLVVGAVHQACLRTALCCVMRATFVREDPLYRTHVRVGTWVCTVLRALVPPSASLQETTVWAGLKPLAQGRRCVRMGATIVLGTVWCMRVHLVVMVRLLGCLHPCVMVHVMQGTTVMRDPRHQQQVSLLTFCVCHKFVYVCV